MSGYLLVSVAHFAHLPVDPNPMSCADQGCPSNAFLVSDSETLRNLAVWSVQLVAVVYLLAVVVSSDRPLAALEPGGPACPGAGPARRCDDALPLRDQRRRPGVLADRLGRLRVVGDVRAHRRSVPVPHRAAEKPAGASGHQPRAGGGARRRCAGEDPRAAPRPDRRVALRLRRSSARLHRRRRPAPRGGGGARARGDPRRARGPAARGDRP